MSDYSGDEIQGRYRLLQLIGEGGMGAVWLAQQTTPVKRRVAIKLIRAGMDSKLVLARFDAERQTLAMMDHPNIARVYDGGMTERGRPFFVMEYLRGTPLTDYCDQARLSIRDRMDLFLQVCRAVQHAHSRGIVHRDLKPSNILVCRYDGRPVTKVIDFGLAKALNQDLTDLTLHTAHGVMVGTPIYMSPEQAELNNLDVDTRTDVYSLGVVLYELLTGTTPLDRERLQRAAMQEVLRLIREEDPIPPSTRLSSSDRLPLIAAQRNVDPSALRHSVTGDLDWIVMKAIEKERARRYETVSVLAEDIQRFLTDDVVQARPPACFTESAALHVAGAQGCWWPRHWQRPCWGSVSDWAGAGKNQVRPALRSSSRSARCRRSGAKNSGLRMRHSSSVRWPISCLPRGFCGVSG